MTLDIPIVLASIYIFVTLNFFGWGVLGDQRFIFFSLVISFLYIVLGLFQQARGKTMLWSKIILLCTFVAVAVFGVTENVMVLRHSTSVEGFINDSGLQTEIAGRFLLLGKNPYKESYEQTDLVKAKYIDEAGNTTNPALYHNAYPPFLLILSAIGFRVFSQVFSWFDIRVVSLIFYAGLLLLGFVKFGISERLIFFLALIGINPLFISHMIQGSNDIVVLTFLLWSLFLLERKQFFLAGLLLGFGIATKQTAWFAFPFYMFYVWKTATQRQFLHFFIPLGSVTLLLFAPFILWDSRALFENLILYISGSLATSYPIHNFGLGIFLVKIGMIPTIYTYYPFWIWQVVIGGLVCVIWLRARKKQCTTADVLSGFSVLLAVSWIFNRFMNFSYLAVLVTVVAIASLWANKNNLNT